jgi:hypothetical protein
MAAYYKVEVTLNSQAVSVGLPSPQSVRVTLPLVGPQGPAGAAGATGAVGPQGPQGVPGTGLEVLTTQGDILYQGAETGERLPIGTSGQVLKVANGIPAWGAESGAVSSVAGRTGAVTLAVTDVANAVSDTDARLSDSRTPTSHTHGNLSNDGKIGTTANLPLITGTNGVIEAGSFGTSAGSFCEGNDARLSDDRDPNLHAASHLPDGADELFDQSLNTTDSVVFQAVAIQGLSGDGDQVLLTDDQGNVFRASASPEAQESARAGLGLGTAATSDAGDFAAAVHTHAAADVTSGTLDIARLPVGTGSTQVAAGNHTHVVADVTGAAASGSITSSGLTQATARILGRTTASTGAVEEITIGSGLSLSAGELSATGGSGVTAVGATLADILSVSGSDLVADDLAADKLYGWDDSESKAIGFIIGSGLSVSGDTLSATASGGSKTYAVFTATDNQPTATAFATLDTRNSIAVLDFDDAATESAVFVGILPEAASLGSGLIVSLRWMATTATSGDVRWSVAWEKSTTDLDSDSFDTATAATATANGTSGIVTVTNITCTTIDSLAAGDLFRLRVQRVGGDGADTMTGDAELVAVEIRSAA